MCKNIITLITALIILGAGIYKVMANNSEKEQIMQDKNVLVTYFSWGGNTKSIAEKIHTRVGGDIFSIEPVTPYPADYNETAYGVAKEQHDKNIHPAIKNTDIASYDIIFVGTPAWWYTMAPPVMTFLEENNFEGKTIVPFITHGGGGKYTIAQDMEKLAKGSKVLSPFVVYGKGDAGTDKELEKWLNSLKY